MPRRGTMALGIGDAGGCAAVTVFVCVAGFCAITCKDTRIEPVKSRMKIRLRAVAASGNRMKISDGKHPRM